MAFESLDYLYTPSRDVAADVRYAVDVLGGRLVFAIDAMGTRVAMVELIDGPPHLVLNDHLEGERAIFVYRVANLRESSTELAARGWEAGHSLEIPQGPVTTFAAPGGQRLAIYEETRPDRIGGMSGRRDW